MLLSCNEEGGEKWSFISLKRMRRWQWFIDSFSRKDCDKQNMIPKLDLIVFLDHCFVATCKIQVLVLMGFFFLMTRVPRGIYHNKINLSAHTHDPHEHVAQVNWGIKIEHKILKRKLKTCANHPTPWLLRVNGTSFFFPILTHAMQGSFHWRYVQKGLIISYFQVYLTN